MSTGEASTVYVDDSGTHKGAKIVTAAFCLSTADRWLAFEDKWHALEDKYSFKHFHMTEFASCRKNGWCRDCLKGKKTEADHPWREWPKSKRKNVLTQLARTIEKFVECGFGIAILKKDYDDHVLNSPARQLAGEPLGDHYFTQAVQVCGGELSKWRAEHCRVEPLKFVFDLSPEYQREEIASVFFGAATNRPEVQDGIEQWFKPAGVTYESRKNVVQLLSADMLAWVTASVRAYDLFFSNNPRPLMEEISIPAKIFVDSRNLGMGFIAKKTFQQWEISVLAAGTINAQADIQNMTD